MNPSPTSNGATRGANEDAPLAPAHRRGHILQVQVATRATLARFLITEEYGGWRILDTLLGARLAGLWETREDAEAHLARRYAWWPALGCEVQP